MPPRAIIVFGAGPGIGNHLTSQFLSQGFTHAILLARNTNRLSNTDAPFVLKASPNAKVDTLQCDLADLSSIPSVLSKIDDLTKGENVEVIAFNAARIRPTEGPLSVGVEEIEEDFKTTNLSLYLIAQHYIPYFTSLAQQNPSLKPSLLVTNSHLPYSPIPQLLSLSLNKSSQRNMVQCLNQAYKESGVHIGLITVEGAVAPENKVLNPTTIAEKAWGFYKKGVEGGLEVKIRE